MYLWVFVCVWEHFAFVVFVAAAATRRQRQRSLSRRITTKPCRQTPHPPPSPSVALFCCALSVALLFCLSGCALHSSCIDILVRVWVSRHAHSRTSSCVWRSFSLCMCVCLKIDTNIDVDFYTDVDVACCCCCCWLCYQASPINVRLFVVVAFIIMRTVFAAYCCCFQNKLCCAWHFLSKRRVL